MFVIDKRNENSELIITKFDHLNKFEHHYKELDKFYSDKRLGSFIENGKTYFRLFAPSAVQVRLCLFNKLDSKNCKEYFMIKDNDGVWEVEINNELYGMYYGYKVYHLGEEISNNHKQICIDPYSKAVATFTSYMNPRLSIIVKEEPYDWEGTSWMQYDWRDLIIYEMHIRDMTAHRSSNSKEPGTYHGLIERGIKGGIEYIKSLGVNAVEIMPSQEFGYCEAPFKILKNNLCNSWNPYERNHWGYMTAAYFAPAAYYSENMKNFKWDRWIGKSGKQITDFKDMVKAFHKEGIAVIMDVVYNHFSEYEIGNLKQIDKEYYFRLDENGNYISKSGCGNDLKTERPMVRRLIVDSVLYWMREYHIDGFRFDLSTLIDMETIETISREARKINPHVILIAEAWGGGQYNLCGFSERNYAAWNDQIRNGIKGENPFNGLGWIFGKWYGNNSPNRIKSYINGTLIRDEFGIFQKKEHSVNYLESHDGYTLGDFIRIASKEFDYNKIIKNIDEFVKLTPYQLKLNKLAALFLLTSQGITMIHSGQEFARTKVIPYRINADDPQRGRIDFNSYNKDNATNYINYNHVEINKELFDYYKGLIELRKKYAAFRHADYNDISFYDHYENEFGLAYLLKHYNAKKQSDDKQLIYFMVLFNASQNTKLEFPLPNGKWAVIVDKNKAGTKTLYQVSKKIILEPVTGAVLRQILH